MIAAAPSENAALMNRAAVKGRSLWDDSRRRLLSNKAAMAGFVVLGLLILIAVFGPFLWPYPFDTQYRELRDLPPQLEGGHLLGMDIYGRDMIARIVAGLGVSLTVGAIATFVSLVIGVAWGAIAGFAGGRVDQLMMRIVDIIYAMPFIFFVILVTVVFGRHIFLIFLAIGAVEWMTMARIVRGQTLMLKQKEFVEAARAAGVKPIGLVVRHILPNLLGPVAVYVTLTMPVVILQESFLSFIGLGVQEPLTSLGRLISEGQKELGKPWLLFAPGHHHGDHAVLAELHRRRPARCARSEGQVGQPAGQLSPALPSAASFANAATRLSPSALASCASFCTSAVCERSYSELASSFPALSFSSIVRAAGALSATSFASAFSPVVVLAAHSTGSAPAALA